MAKIHKDTDSIEGDWQATKEHCGSVSLLCGLLPEDDGTVVVSENWGSYRCGCVPNCFPKRGSIAHRMTKEGDNVWTGRLGFKPLRLDKNDDGTKINDGRPMTMRRL